MKTNENTAPTETPNTFTAAMVFPADKKVIQTLRAKFELTEKQLLNVMLKVVTENPTLLSDEVTNFKATQQQDSEAEKAKKIEAKLAVKTQAKATRDAAAAIKAAERTAAKNLKETAKAAARALKKSTKEPVAASTEEVPAVTELVAA